MIYNLLDSILMKIEKQKQLKLEIFEYSRQPRIEGLQSEAKYLIGNIYIIINNNITGMHQLSQPNTQITHNQHHQVPALPYQQLPTALPPSLSAEQFIHEWVDRIFISNRKIESEARIAKFKLFELSSCSSVYELIRHKIEQIAQKLRNFVDVSFGMLNKQNNNLSQLVQSHSEGTSIQSSELNFSTEKMVYVPTAKMVVLFYKFICESLRQVCNLWKIIYPSIPVRDLEKSTFQKSISTFVLQIFSMPSKTFSPLKMYPSMSLVNKTKFICADSSEGIARRLEMTKFSEDELKRVLLQKKTKINTPQSLNLQELNDSQRRLLQEIIGHAYFSKKVAKTQQKLKIDIPFIQELKDKMVSTEEVELYPLDANLDQFCRLNQVKAKCKDIKAQLLTPFEPNSGLLYELEDNSSQEELGNFYDDKQCENQELYLQSQDILMEYINAKTQIEHKQNDASAKLSSSTANEEHNEIKNQELEIHNDIQIDHYNPTENQSQETKVWEMHASQNYKKDEDHTEKTLSQISTGQFTEVRKENNNSHFARKNEKILRSENSKRYLQEQKQKLQKYRKELQKEKQQLLREVQRFMKEKEKDQRDFKRINNCFNFQSTHRHARSTCECHHQLKKYNFEPDKHKFALKGLKEMPSSCRKVIENEMEQMNEVGKEQNSVQQQIANQIYKDMNAEALQEANNEVNYQNGNSSNKKKQKNKKRLEKQQPKTYRLQQKNTPRNQKPNREIDEDEAQLIKFMDNLKINEATRVTWNIEEKKIESWKERLVKIRNNQTLSQKIPMMAQSKPEKSKKKNKR